jgi:hypothetical protein
METSVLLICTPCSLALLELLGLRCGAFVFRSSPLCVVFFLIFPLRTHWLQSSYRFD